MHHEFLYHGGLRDLCTELGFGCESRGGAQLLCNQLCAFIDVGSCLHFTPGPLDNFQHNNLFSLALRQTSLAGAAFNTYANCLVAYSLSGESLGGNV